MVLVKYCNSGLESYVSCHCIILEIDYHKINKFILTFQTMKSNNLKHSYPVFSNGSVVDPAYFRPNLDLALYCTTHVNCEYCRIVSSKVKEFFFRKRALFYKTFRIEYCIVMLGHIYSLFSVLLSSGRTFFGK
jgi:hypothetical protein